MPNRKCRGYSILEILLVFLILIVAVIATIAVPRFGRAAATNDSAVVRDLAVLRNAIDLYRADHGGTYPTLAMFATQLTQYTDSTGNPQATKDATHLYGPHLRCIPALPVGAATGNTGVAAQAGVGVGWIYNASSGTIHTNTTSTEVDSAGNPYMTY